MLYIIIIISIFILTYYVKKHINNSQITKGKNCLLIIPKKKTSYLVICPNGARKQIL